MSLRLRSVAGVSATSGSERPVPHAALVDQLVAKVPADALSPDLALLAYTAPDAYPYKCVATHLNYRAGGKAHSVALTGQGLGAPFTALMAAAAYERAGRSTRSLIAIVESAEPGLAGSDSGVLLACEAGDGPWTVAEVAAFETSGELTAGLGRLPEDTLHVLGPGIAPPGGRADVHRAELGSYCTRVWLAMARNWDAWSRSRTVIALCDADVLTGARHLAVFRQAAA